MLLQSQRLFLLFQKYVYWPSFIWKKREASDSLDASEEDKSEVFQVEAEVPKDFKVEPNGSEENLESSGVDRRQDDNNLFKLEVVFFLISYMIVWAVEYRVSFKSLLHLRRLSGAHSRKNRAKYM